MKDLAPEVYLLLNQLAERGREVRDLQAALNKAKTEAELYRLGFCDEVIPNSFIACGEGDNYCSSACMLHAKLKKATLEAAEWHKAYEEAKNAIHTNG